MRVGILGSGLMGGKLGTIFARAETREINGCRPLSRAVMVIRKGPRAYAPGFTLTPASEAEKRKSHEKISAKSHKSVV